MSTGKTPHRISIVATCAACPARVRLDAPADLPLVNVVEQLTELHDAAARVVTCQNAPASLRVRIEADR